MTTIAIDQPLTVAEWMEIFSHRWMILVYCIRCAKRGLYVPLEHGRCPRCFEMHNEVIR